MLQNKKNKKNALGKSFGRKMLRLTSFFIGMQVLVLSNVNMAFAKEKDYSDVISPILSLKNLFIAIVGAVGGIVLVKNIMEAAAAWQQQDSGTLNMAIKGIVAGILMVGVSGVLGYMGVK